MLAGKEQEWKVVVVHWGGFFVRLLLLVLLVSLFGHAFAALWRSIRVMIIAKLYRRAKWIMHLLISFVAFLWLRVRLFACEG